jgi:uncharacterized SAM-binding protein YcdF (DUF218 family)
MTAIKIKAKYFALSIVIFIILLFALSRIILSSIGEFLVFDETALKSDAIVVLNTGMEYYPRLIESADLFKRGLSDKIIINGNRKSDKLREIEDLGFVECCPWYENSLRILSLFGVPRNNVICISAEDTYDTVSEAKIVGEEIVKNGLKRVIITTSKSHTRRAKCIWKRMYRDRLSLSIVSAKADPYDPNGWWKDGRQIRWVLAEYGAWIYYGWKKLRDAGGKA